MLLVLQLEPAERLVLAVTLIRIALVLMVTVAPVAALLVFIASVASVEQHCLHLIVILQV